MSSIRSMAAALGGSRGYRFAEFEYDPRSRQLRKHGIRVLLQPQPLSILLALLESPGALVTRENLRQRLWGAHTFVEFEQGLNSAVKRLRDVLGDSAESPKYIETILGEGYRFIGEAEHFVKQADAPSPFTLVPVSTLPSVRPQSLARWRWISGAMLIAAIAMFVITLRRTPSARPALNFQARDW